MTQNPKTAKILLSEYPEFLDACLLVKKASAKANKDLSCLSEEEFTAVAKGADRLIACDKTQIPSFNTSIFGAVGKGTSDAAAQALAESASELAGTSIEPAKVCLNQATADTTATALEILIHDTLRTIKEHAEPLAQALQSKGEEFKGIVKCGRLGLRDSAPVCLGNNFHAYAVAVSRSISDLSREAARWNKSYLGAGDVGTGFCIDPRFASKATDALSDLLGRPIEPETELLYGLGQAAKLLAAHSAIENLAFTVWRIAHDFEFMASGPRGGIREIALPAVAPGSSIMPGKINPTVAEMAMATSNRILANREALMQGVHRSWSGTGPEKSLAVKCFIDAGRLLSKTCDVFISKVVSGITANEEKCRQEAENSWALLQVVECFAGHEAAQRTAERAKTGNLTIKEAAVEEGILDEESAEILFNIDLLPSKEGMKAVMEQFPKVS